MNPIQQFSIQQNLSVDSNIISQTISFELKSTLLRREIKISCFTTLRHLLFSFRSSHHEMDPTGSLEMIPENCPLDPAGRLSISLDTEGCMSSPSSLGIYNIWFIFPFLLILHDIPCQLFPLLFLIWVNLDIIRVFKKRISSIGSPHHHTTDSRREIHSSTLDSRRPRQPNTSLLPDSRQKAAETKSFVCLPQVTQVCLQPRVFLSHVCFILQVHQRQTERMRARSDWFLSDPSGLVTYRLREKILSPRPTSLGPQVVTTTSPAHCTSRLGWSIFPIKV